MNSEKNHYKWTIDFTHTYKTNKYTEDETKQGKCPTKASWIWRNHSSAIGSIRYVNKIQVNKTKPKSLTNSHSTQTVCINSTQWKWEESKIKNKKEEEKTIDRHNYLELYLFGILN